MPTSEDIRKRASVEDEIPVADMTPEQLKRKVARENKRYYRELEKRKAEQAAARKKAAADAATAEEWWTAQRATLDSETRAKLEAVHQEMLDWVLVMKDYVEGTDGTSEQDLEDTIADIKALVEEHGECDTGFIAVPKFWADPIFQSVITRAKNVPKFRADEVFAKYGYLTALPSRYLEPFRAKFMTQKVELFRPTYIAHVCPDCAEVRHYTLNVGGECNTLPAGKTAPDATEVMKLRCQRCDPTGQDLRTKEWKAQEAKKIAARDILRSTTEENDKFGRINSWRK